jgi:hypothetical protein
MIQLPYAVRSRLQAARLTPALLDLIQQECDQRGYLLHPTAIEGHGGFGIVFQGEGVDGEKKAIKVSVSRPGMEALFKEMCDEEGRKACELSGIPHIAAGETYWFSELAPLFFLVSQYVEGSNLKTYQERVPGPIAEARLRAWATQLAEALSAMHQRGLVHRDVKPENILLERATDQVFLTDLGVAKYMQEGTLEALRTTGTHPYAPLEQILGSATPKSDQYALGIVLFEVAAGVGALPPVAVPRRGYPVARPKRLDPQRSNPTLSADVAAVIERLAALKPGDRYPSMQAAHEVLLRLRTPPARQQTEPMREPSTAPLRRAPAQVVVPASAPARPAASAAQPAFAWRPLWQLRRLLFGGPIQRGGPALSPGGVVWLMILYLLWGFTTCLGVASGWAAPSGQHLDGFWVLIGALALVLWRSARTWNLCAVTRRGSLRDAERRGWTLLCLAWLLASSPGLVAFWLGFPAPIWTPAWLECIGCWAMWLVCYLSLEVWLN